MTQAYNPPADATVHSCEYCHAVEPTAELLALHRGLEHYEKLDSDEQSAYETAYAAEQSAISRFRLLALGALIVLYFGLLMIYAFVI